MATCNSCYEHVSVLELQITWHVSRGATQENKEASIYIRETSRFSYCGVASLIKYQYFTFLPDTKSLLLLTPVLMNPDISPFNPFPS